MAEIPTPTDTGSAGTQQAGTGEIETLTEESLLSGVPITKRVEGLAATYPRGMGGQVTAQLIAGSFTQLSHDLQTTKQELKETRTELKQTWENFSELKTRAAVLEERANVAERDRPLKNLSITAGSMLIGTGIELYRNNFDKFGYLVGGVGLVFVILGWFPRKVGGEK